MGPRKRHFRTEDGYKPDLLVRFARDHLFAAKVLYPMGAPCLDSAGYLAHLGLELLLKARLLSLTGEFPDSHSLPELHGLLVEADPAFQLHRTHLDILSAFDSQFQLRYPHPKATPGVAQGDCAALELLESAIDERLPAELQQVPDSSNQAEKGHRQILRSRDELLGKN